MKIENRATIKLNYSKLIAHLNSVLEIIPREHLRGVSKLVLVDYVTDSRLNPQMRRELPGLYHPKMPGSPQAWMEIALKPLTPEGSFWKRLSARLALRANVTATLLSLIAQHYYVTLSHGVRKEQYEQAVRSYVDRHLALYARTRTGLRARLIRPFLPWLERLARWVHKHQRRSR
jgi:hypothetical protein